MDIKSEELKEIEKINVPLAYVKGEPYLNIPKDLYLPPDALEVVLDSFEGPLDLLLYLIKSQNFDILELPVAKITDQYIQYIDLMQELKLELAAEYMLMAATLAEIKSKLLLPLVEEDSLEEDDPRAELIRRLQEYERYKKASLNLEVLPRIERDFYLPNKVSYKAIKKDEVYQNVDLEKLVVIFHKLMEQTKFLTPHDVKKDFLSVREKMTLILNLLKQDKFVDFKTLLDIEEGKSGLIVSFLAILELIKLTLIDCAQANQDSAIFIKLK
ncbi:segregation/condensation protein A [Gammaproteobacteria bacterium]|jgi:segregation and condensation protein A|nr:segregation/condensation protein A [Gammaproteobacteria bacterium]MBT7814594.1 segregation/condensation protein A [Gammaproteobacteria bacterium]MDC0482195.1 segregation/condensation protein A [Gammaproteobacteria bacterium]